MKIAYIENPFDHSRIAAGGVSKYIIKAFENNGAEVLPVELKSKPFIYYLEALKERLYAKLGKQHRVMRAEAVWKSVGKNMSRELAGKDYDAVFSFGSLPVALFPTDKPVFFWTDAVFRSLVGYYPDYMNMTSATLKSGDKLEELAFSKARTAFLCTKAETEAARKQFPNANIEFAPFGANIDREPSDEEVFSEIDKYYGKKINLLLIGWDWERKGGDDAVEVVRALTAKGYDATLHAVGPEKRCSIRGDKIEWHGRIDKSIPEGLKKFESLLYSSTFLVHFSKAETYGHVLCEANAFGLPAITSQTGGIPEVIRDGVNGMTFSESATPDEIADYIISSAFADEDKYKDYRRTARKEYTDRLNWDGAVKIVLEEMKKYL
jgi:glycosyltransferase involved in cell wall biosynthesis